MRIDKNQRISIINIVHQFDPYAKVRLFGSRLNDNAVGGDIDLLIESKTIGFKEKLIIRYQLKEKLGDRKIDLIVTDKPNTAFTRFVYKNSLVL
jgi:predicted nucleotidyltransferase